ncbi:MAG: chorismate-binding protein, partial [Gammaproteobacteria bacterium]
MVEYIQTEVHCDLLHVHRTYPTRYPYLLESVAQAGLTARYDILFGFPEQTLELTELDTLKGEGFTPCGADFLANFDTWWSQHNLPAASGIPFPFTGGWFVYLGYELAAQIEPRLHYAGGRASAKTSHNSQPIAQHKLPVAYAARIPAAFIKDHSSGKLFLIAERGRTELLDLMQADLSALNQSAFRSRPLLNGALQEEPPQRYIDGVQRILRYIKEGDIFQVNLSREWCGELTEGVAAVDIYQCLREQNPAPFAGLAQYGDAAIISSSPERLVSVRDGIIATRPIAGTHPRDQTHLTDPDDMQTLLSHPKERAEHIMLIDLGRNDLGRVCVPGSVTVDELMTVESYAHVHHIVSNIRGRLRSSITPGQVLRAVFP